MAGRIAQELRSPHLVLADIRGVVSIRRQLAQGHHHLLGSDLALGRGHHQRIVLLPALDALQPRLGASSRVLAAGGGQEGFDGRLHIGHHRHFGQAVLAHLSGVDVDVDDAGPRREAVETAGDAIVEAGAGGDQQIALRDGEIGIGGAVHAEHAHGESVMLIERALAHQGGGDGQPEALRKGGDRLMGRRADGAATHVEQRPAGLADQLQGGLNRSRFRRGRRTEASGDGGAGLHRHVVELLDPHILGHIDQHRPGAAAGGDQEGLGHDTADVARVAHHPGVLHDRQGDAEDVGLLEGIGADGGTGHLTGDHHHRHRVHLGGGDAGHQVGGAGTGGAKADAHLTSGAGIGIGRVGAALLVAHQDVLQPAASLGLVQLVVDGQDRATRVAEDVAHAVAMQGIHQGIGPVHPLRHHLAIRRGGDGGSGGGGIEGGERHGRGKGGNREAQGRFRTGNRKNGGTLDRPGRFAGVVQRSESTLGALMRARIRLRLAAIARRMRAGSNQSPRWRTPQCR